MEMDEKDYPILNTTTSEKAIFHDMCGCYVIRVNRRPKCKNCIDPITHPQPTLPSHSLKNIAMIIVYSLKYVKSNIVKYLPKCEKIFKDKEPSFNNCTDIKKGMKELFLRILILTLNVMILNAL